MRAGAGRADLFAGRWQGDADDSRLERQHDVAGDERVTHEPQ